MKKIRLCPMLLTAAMAASPLLSHAQGAAAGLRGFRGVLEQLYDEMIGMSSELIGVAQGIAGFAATWYIAARVWRHIVNAEPIDFYPLFRPFVLGFCIMVFPAVLALINGILKPTVTGTAAMMENSNAAIEELLMLKTRAVMQTDEFQIYVGPDGGGDRDRWYRYTYDDDPANEGFLEGIGNDIRFQTSKLFYCIKFLFKFWLSELLMVFFEAAALCIDTLRTFQLIVLGILGPLVFGLSVFDGLQQTLISWFARYINIYLWLPVANIFGSIIGKIQENMLKLDIAQVQSHGETFFSQMDLAYMIFLIIGIVGYFMVPTVAGYIVQANGAAFSQKISNVVSSTTSSVSNVSSKIGQQFTNPNK